MPRAKTNKFYRTFSKGLITEAGYLTYPEDASSDELNTILSRRGNRSRRLGFDYQDNFGLNDLGASDTIADREFVWSSVNNDPNVTFTCLQIGSKIHFFQMNNEPLSTQLQPFSIDLLTYKIPTAPTGEFDGEYVDMSAGAGYLFVAHKYMDPISVEYVPSTDSLIVIPIVIQVRDFAGVYDALANDEEPSQLTAQHHYNLLNQGWLPPGSRTVDISTPSYPGTTPGSAGGSTDVGTGGSDAGGKSDAGAGGPSYYDPYTGETNQYYLEKQDTR